MAQVDFYYGRTLLDTDASAPYAFTWGSVAAGTCTSRPSRSRQCRRQRVVGDGDHHGLGGYPSGLSSPMASTKAPARHREDNSGMGRQAR